MGAPNGERADTLPPLQGANVEGLTPREPLPQVGVHQTPHRTANPGQSSSQGASRPDQAGRASAKTDYAKLAEQKATAVVDAQRRSAAAAAAASAGAGSSRWGSHQHPAGGRRNVSIIAQAARLFKRASTLVRISKRSSEGFDGVKMHDQLSDPAFVASVIELMADPRVVETFSIFDSDNSGSISIPELREVITMLQLASNKTDLETMLVELDINGDGGVDLWEFCVYLQKGRDARAKDESNWELDQAFQLFRPDEDDQGRIDEDALKRMMTNELSGMGLDAREWGFMWKQMVEDGLVREGKIVLVELRNHECWTIKKIGGETPTHTPTPRH